MISNKIILFPVEVKSRELDSKIILAMHVINHLRSKVDIIIGKSSEVNKFLKSGIKKPFIYFANGLDNDEIFYRDINKNNGKFFFLDEEGAITSKTTEDKYPRIKTNHPCFRFADKYYFWGGVSQKDLRIRQSDYVADKSLISGNLRIELSKPKYFRYFNSYYSENKLKNYILINTAFGVANPIVDTQTEVNHWKNKKNSANIEGNLLAPLNYQRKLLKLFLMGIKKLIKNNPNEEFILRPHPGENILYYQNELLDYKNLKIIKSGPVQMWIANCKFMIHPGCTTAIESFFSEKNSICYAPIFDKDHIQMLPYQISQKAKTYDELNDYFISNLNNSKKNYEKNKYNNLLIIKPYIFNVDNNSFEIITKDLVSTNIQNIKKFYQEIGYTWKDYIPKVIKNFYNYIKHKIKLSLNQNNINQLILLNEKDKLKFDHLHLDELNKKINIFKQMQNYTFDINIKSIDKNTYILTASDD